MKLRAKLLDIYAIIAGMPADCVHLGDRTGGLRDAVASGDVTDLGKAHITLYLAFHPKFAPDRMTVAAIRRTALTLLVANRDVFGSEGVSRYDAGIRAKTDQERILKRILAARRVDAPASAPAQGRPARAPTPNGSPKAVTLVVPPAPSGRPTIKSSIKVTAKPVATVRPAADEPPFVPTEAMPLPPLSDGKCFVNIKGRWIAC